MSNAEWTLLKPLIPSVKPGGYPRSVNIREILNVIFYIQRSGCAGAAVAAILSTVEDGLTLFPQLAYCWYLASNALRDSPTSSE